MDLNHFHGVNENVIDVKRRTQAKRQIIFLSNLQVLFSGEHEGAKIMIRRLLLKAFVMQIESVDVFLILSESGHVASFLVLVPNEITAV